MPNLKDENKVLPYFNCRCLNVLSDIEVCEQDVIDIISTLHVVCHWLILIHQNFHLYLRKISFWLVFFNYLPYFAVGSLSFYETKHI
jgi:hypothetical protein